MTRPLKKRPLPDYTTRGCPLTKNNSKWCFRLCEFDENERGICGRIAPHSVKSAVQVAIMEHNKKKQKEQEKRCAV